MRYGALTRGLSPLAVLVACLAITATASALPLNPSVEVSAMSCPTATSCAAVGDYANGVGQAEGLLVSERAGRWTHSVEAALPTNAGLDPLNESDNAGMADIDCVSAGNCTAVGVYTDTTDNDRGLLLTETAGHWKRGVEARLPSNAMHDVKGKRSVGDNLVLLSDACVSAGNCFAVGNYITAGDTIQGLIVTEHSGHWQTGRAAPLPANATVRGQKAVIYAITCLPGGGCTASGSYVDTDGDQQAVLLTEQGGRWTAADEGTLPATAAHNPQATPIAIGCVDTGDCVVAGDFENGNDNSLGMLLSETGGTWASGTQASLPSDGAAPTSYNAQTTILTSVSCPELDNCTVVGSYTDDSGNAQALLLNQSNGAWAAGQQVALPSNENRGETEQTAGLDTVSCPSAGNCVGGGEYTDTADNDDSLLVTESNGTWSPGVEVKLPAGAGMTQYSAVDSVTCASVGNCTAIGTYNDSYGDTFAYATRELDGVWMRATQLPSPPADSTAIKLAVQRLLTPTGKAATVSAIHKAKGFEQIYAALEPGTFTLDWYHTQAGKQTLVGAATVSASTPSQGKLKLRLTGAGKKLFAAGGRIKLTAQATFKPQHGGTISGSKVFTLQ